MVHHRFIFYTNLQVRPETATAETNELKNMRNSLIDTEFELRTLKEKCASFEREKQEALRQLQQTHIMSGQTGL